jgi:hypothetical protein
MGSGKLLADGANGVPGIRGRCAVLDEIRHSKGFLIDRLPAHNNCY